MNHELSEKLFAEACLHIPGGVDSPVRAFKGVGGNPLFIVRAKGATVTDADGNDYIDYVGSWGPAILGHAAPEVIRALYDAMKLGVSFGAPTVKEIELAMLVKQAVPSVELVRFVNSGTEATMSALRVARAYTRRDKIIKFDGCYHGHADHLLVKAGSGAATCGTPDSLGVPQSFSAHTLIANYNNISSLEKLFDEYKNQIAAVILEPVIGNMGCIPPEPEFLKNLRELCTANNTLLIFDEVMTGFRVAWGGAQEIYQIKPDLTCFGKIIGGGLPVGAYGGKKEIMEYVAPLGGVYQAGTLSGNPLAMAAGIATLNALKKPGAYDLLETRGAQLENGLKQIAQQKNEKLIVNRVGSLFSFFFTDKKITDADGARQANKNRFIEIFHKMLNEGIYLAPSAFEAGFISLSHTTDDIQKTLSAFEKSL